MVKEPRTEPSTDVGRTFKILITDDDRGSRETLAGLLADRGFPTVQAASGEEAIEIVRVEIVHLVFFDMHMPRMTGLEALQQVRLLNELLPAILVTADATRELIRRALQAQVYSVIPKPINKNIVLHTLDRALQLVYGSQPSDPPPGPKDTPEPEARGNADRPVE
jgi:two-component system, response regulator PdtaR